MQHSKKLLSIFLVVCLITIFSNIDSTFYQINKVKSAPSFAGGTGTSGDPYQIQTCEQLQNINNDLTAYYVLTSNVDCSMTNPSDESFDDEGIWADTYGFEPIGDFTSWLDYHAFSGNFDGAGYTIDGLYISRSSDNYIGLFSVVSGNISDLKITNANITGNSRTGAFAGRLLATSVINNIRISSADVNGSSYTGGLAGGSFGYISNSSFAGSVEGASYTGGFIGGLSGTSGDRGVVTNCFSSGTVSGGTEEVGGLIGVSDTYTDVLTSSSTASVTGYWTVGGLVGSVLGIISESHATGNVTSTMGYGIGGLVGYLKNGSITKSYAIGDISADSDSYDLDMSSSYAGGLVGMSDGGPITKSYATGDVTGTSYRVGGLVGGTNSTIENCYATGSVTGGDRVGGLIGGLTGTTTNSYSTGLVTAQGIQDGSASSRDGGGGGGGYFGGEGGQSDASPGAGGSGYFDPELVTNGSLVTGTDGNDPMAVLPPGTSDSDYVAGVGVGGVSSEDTPLAGGNGLVVLNYSSKQTFSYTGSSQAFTVPDGVTSIDVKIWGAGGGGANYSDSYLYQGGSGGLATGTITVTPGQILVIIVGGGGEVGLSNNQGGLGGYGGGGYGTRGDASGAGGGGLSGIFTNGHGTDFEKLTQSDAIIIAGGGGGGTGFSGPGGAGGGTEGNSGGKDYISCGGTQKAGGSCLLDGDDGIALHGGNGDIKGVRSALIPATQYGGLVGYNDGTITNSFWNTETSEQADEITGATGKTTTQMKNINTYSDNWDIAQLSSYTDEIWYIDNGNAYPQLGWQMTTIYYTLSYSAQTGGSISGTTPQTVVSSANGTAVTAIANNGYRFVRWSDNSIINPRIDTNISSNLSVSAIFEEVSTGGGGIIITPSGVGGGIRDAKLDNVNIGSTINIGEIKNDGVNVLTYISNPNNFKAPESGSNWNFGNHSFQITNLDLLNYIITLTFSSEPQTITLKKGESKNIDLDGDKIADISATFTDTYINRAEVTIKSLTPNSEVNNNANPISTNKFLFSRNLKFGDNNSDVKELQKYLNANGFIVSKIGVGSLGKETTKFGTATRNALIKFQKANKIVPASGYFGPLTRTLINGK